MFTDNYVYYCKTCNSFEAYDDKYANCKCPKCSMPLRALGVTVEEWNNLTDDEMMFVLNNSQPYLPDDFIPSYKQNSSQDSLNLTLSTDIVREKKNQPNSYFVNKYVTLKDSSLIYAPGKYRIGEDLKPGEYYFWGSNIYVLDRKENIINHTGCNDCYVTFKGKRIITVENAHFTPIDNIEYTYKNSDALEPGHMYRGQIELPQGTYKMLSMQEPDISIDSRNVRTIRLNSYVETLENNTWPFISEHEDISQYKSFSVEDRTNYVILKNCRAQLSEERQIISQKTLGQQRVDTMKRIDKLISDKNDSSKIINGDSYYFYVSAPDPVTELYIKE